MKRREQTGTTVFLDWEEHELPLRKRFEELYAKFAQLVRDGHGNMREVPTAEIVRANAWNDLQPLVRRLGLPPDFGYDWMRRTVMVHCSKLVN